MRRVQAGGIRLAYRTWGPAGAPPVVLLHALGEQSSDWTPVALALAPSWRVYAPDLRGHGASDWSGPYTIEQLTADLHAFLDAFDLDQVTLGGHSIGAPARLPVRRAVPGSRRPPHPGRSRPAMAARTTDRYPSRGHAAVRLGRDRAEQRIHRAAGQLLARVAPAHPGPDVSRRGRTGQSCRPAPARRHGRPDPGLRADHDPGRAPGARRPAGRIHRRRDWFPRQGLCVD